MGQVRTAVRAHAEALFRAAFGEPANPRAHDWRDREKGSISMTMRGDERGLWKDFAADAGGDLFDLVAVTRCGLLKARDDFPKVLEEAGLMTGLVSGHPAWRGFPKPAPPPEQEPEGPVRERDWGAATVLAAIDLIRPVAETPAAAYLVRRGVSELPETGLGWLPPAKDLPLMNCWSGALLVWAIGANGWPTGGQRILVTPKGAPSKAKVSKPAFGRIGSCPARFAARDADLAKGPLVIAEGPETALSVRQATGLETWAVFGVGFFKNAPLPKGRRVILAPDRDARESNAGRSFRRAVLLHRSQGVELMIAEAPEPEGSKRDLNDTLRGRGDDAVREAIKAARPVRDADMEDAAT
ncbi:MAG: hypothetical protein F4213_09265 [Boseongicola sp. SB0677_bin_26]|nr:hypothetical protein [Boseongicola sp. SB0665_bin_10]MYG26200.1 hypothetical protein [Boseongicola sp. SB0677_bin_26]